MSKKYVALIISILLIPVFLLSQEKKNVQKKDYGFKLIILPFYNYTGAGSKYLKDYIPEMIKKNLHLKYSVLIHDVDDIGNELKKLNVTGKALYRKSIIRSMATELKADAVIMGRYLVQGKNVRIDFRVYTQKRNKFFKGSSYITAVDDRLLDTVEKFAQSRSSWIKTVALADLLPADADKDTNAIVRYMRSIRSSKAGALLNNKWILAALVLILFYLLSIMMTKFFEKVLLKITSKTTTTVDDDIVKLSKKPVKWIVFIIGIKVALMALAIKTTLGVFFSNLSIAVIIGFMTYIIMGTIDIVIHAWGNKIAERLDSRIDDDLVPLFIKLSKVVIVSIGLLMILSRFEIDIAPLIASLGIAGFAIGFAVKDSLANIIGGIVLILDHSFVVGDKVNIDGDTGVILEVGLRNTKLKTYDNEIIVIPNGDLMNKKFKNYVLPDPMIRVVINFSVAYGSNIEEVQKLILGVLQSIEGICEDPAPGVDFIEMADSSLNFIGKIWVPQYADQYSKQLEARTLVYNTLVKNNIDIPFPTRTVFLAKDD